MTDLPALPETTGDTGAVLTLKETAERLGVSVKTVRRMVTKGAFPGARKDLMPNGKGEQWVVPVSSLTVHEAGRTSAKATDQGTTGEVTDLRAQVIELTQDRDRWQMLALDRDRTIDRLLATIQHALPAPADQAPPAHKRWWKRRATPPNQ